MWSPGLFKGHVSPHELLQAVSNASKKRFTTSVQSDARDFLTWFLNELHFDLGGTKAPGSSAIVRAFQGMVEVKTSKLRIINQDTAQQQHVLSDGSRCTNIWFIGDVILTHLRLTPARWHLHAQRRRRRR